MKDSSKCHLTNSNSTIGERKSSVLSAFSLIDLKRKNDEEVINIDCPVYFVSGFLGSLFKSETNSEVSKSAKSNIETKADSGQSTKMAKDF